ncbi:MAG: carbon-nitrogen hydrolase family protein [Candidatus Latescibacterota bacterium]
MCGYPPVERDSVGSIDTGAQREALDRVAGLAQEHSMFMAVGLVTIDEAGARNSLCLLPPDGRARQVYDKRALWGWDVGNYRPGEADGICDVDGVRVGLRICYEARFPEYFRELFRERIDLALVALCHVGSAVRREVYRSHLVSRTSENAMYVLSANSTSRAQLAPTCLIDPDGELVGECQTGAEELLTGTIRLGEPGFSRKGRIVLSRALSGMDTV